MAEIVMAFTCAGIAQTLFPILDKYNPTLALGSVGFRIIEAVFLLLSALCALSLLTLTRQTIDTKAAIAPLLALRHWSALVVGALAFGLGSLLYYIVFFQSKLIPRWLSAWGIIGALAHCCGAVLTLFSTQLSTTTVALSGPIFGQEILLAFWLIFRGFNSNGVSAPEHNR